MRTPIRHAWCAKRLALFMLASTLLAMAQDQPACIQLTGSSTCPAFSSAYVSTNKSVTDLFSFLTVVNDVDTFDSQLNQYITGEWRRRQYQTLLGCGAVNLSDDDLYARFSTSVLCNGIVQNSIPFCEMSDDAKRPLCAPDCANYAQSEEYIVADQDLCPSPGSNAQSQIRSDFEVCALPADALSPSNCVQASANEPDNCGYGNSTFGLCSYCSSGGINSTDTCCYNSNAEQRCEGVVLPTITPQNFTATPTSTPSPTSTALPGSSAVGHGLSGGAIAGIVVGSVVGALLLALLLFFCIRRARNKRQDEKETIFNQPSPTRKGPVSQPAPTTPPQGYEVLPGGRIARMSALEGHSGGSPSRRGDSRLGSSTGAAAAGVAAAGAAAGSMTGRRRGENQSSSDSFAESSGPETRAGVLRPPPTNIRRHGSLSSNSVLAGEDPQSPTSAGGISSPPGINSQQSEQLPFFKDYYSQDDIHPGERVAVLWAYQPRANDEFSLERGDMLKVVGIWDDGWATGIMLDERAENWDAQRQALRDSGVSNASGRGRDASPTTSGEIKAFPLVCVCLPDHWRKTIEGDGSTETGSSAQQGT
ncbi:hypothetical protein F4678DRAFT_474038 [Xylaria arbuscula]|nr:hypothetical protein F4678DRAFT_474038 [Xylaria arbuscula]